MFFLRRRCRGRLQHIGFLAAGSGLFPGQVGLVIGAISTSGAVGCIFFPWIMGPVTNAVGLAASVYLIPVMCLAMAGVVYSLRVYQQRGAVAAARA